uniref:Uncharacterized protein n=1 Tax=Vespula pensylvanica TaxID=30213 RepID=A0A834U3V6_VESPE|nr:hypothetical protein H0235_012089 [Vespula pensylvanica]
MKLSFLFNELTAPFSVEAERSVGGGAPGSAGAAVGGPQVLAASPAPSTPTTPAATSPSASSPASSVSSSPSPSSSPTSALLAGLDKSVLQDRPGRKEVEKEGEQRVKASAGAPSLAAVSAN